MQSLQQLFLKGILGCCSWMLSLVPLQTVAAPSALWVGLASLISDENVQLCFFKQKISFYVSQWNVFIKCMTIMSQFIWWLKQIDVPYIQILQQSCTVQSLSLQFNLSPNFIHFSMFFLAWISSSYLREYQECLEPQLLIWMPIRWVVYLYSVPQMFCLEYKSVW